MRIIVVCGLLTFLPLAPTVAGQETDYSLLVRLSAGPVLRIPGTEFSRDFKIGNMITLGVGVPVSSKLAILATFDHGNFKLDQSSYFENRGLSLRYAGVDTFVSVDVLTMQARRDIQLPLGLKGYVSAGPGWMWWRTGGIRLAVLLGCHDPPSVCRAARTPDDAGLVAVAGFGLRAPMMDGPGRFFIESQYTHGFFTDAPTYLPIRFGWDIPL